MFLSGTETDHLYLDDKRATGLECPVCCMPQLHLTSNPAVPNGCLSVQHLGVAEKTHDELEHAKAQRKRRRAANVELQYQQALANGDVALWSLSNHIYRSLPAHLRASSSILGRLWFSAHYKVATLALVKAHREARRLGLIRVADRVGFLATHCRWFGWFCSFSLFVSSWLLPPHKELI